MRPKSDEEVATAARAWGRHRLLVLAVKDARNSCRCEVEYRGSMAPDDPSEPPCWKTHEWDYEGEPMNASDWCEPCLERQRWHLALVVIKRAHGALLRRLQRISASPRADVGQSESQS